MVKCKSLVKTLTGREIWKQVAGPNAILRFLNGASNGSLGWTAFESQAAKYDGDYHDAANKRGAAAVKQRGLDADEVAASAKLNDGAAPATPASSAPASTAPPTAPTTPPPPIMSRQRKPAGWTRCFWPAHIPTNAHAGRHASGGYGWHSRNPTATPHCR